MERPICPRKFLLVLTVVRSQVKDQDNRGLSFPLRRSSIALNRSCDPRFASSTSPSRARRGTRADGGSGRGDERRKVE